MRTQAEWLEAIAEQSRGVGSQPSATLANLRLLDEALVEHPASVRLWNRRGDFIQLLEEMDPPYSLSDALASYERARALDPTDSEAYESLGYFFDAVADRVGDAEDMFRKAIELGAGADSWAGLARVLAQLDRSEEALKLLEPGSCPYADAPSVVDVRWEINQGRLGPNQSAG